MIFLYLRTALLFLVKLIIPPSPRRTRIDPCAKCPACGSRSGKIEAVEVAKKVFVEHHCNVCKCFWYEAPISLEVAIRATSVVVPPAKA